jgi:hypothetical protein
MHPLGVVPTSKAETVVCLQPTMVCMASGIGCVKYGFHKNLLLFLRLMFEH